MTAKTNNGRNKQRREQKQIPFGDDNQNSSGKNKQRRELRTARTDKGKNKPYIAGGRGERSFAAAKRYPTLAAKARRGWGTQALG
jgi:hypothetical protein